MLTGYVLAGGRSTRMGADKALLHLSTGETLLEHAVALLASVAPEVRIVAPRERYTNFAWEGEFVEDIYQGCGPLGGIHAALRGSPTDLNLFLAVDMPEMTPECLSFLLAHAAEGNWKAVVPVVDGRPQPLCCVLRKSVEAQAEQLLHQGNYKVSALFKMVETRFVAEDELKSNGFGAELFRNVNTPEEWRGEAHRQ